MHYYFSILSGSASNMYPLPWSLPLMLHTLRPRCFSAHSKSVSLYGSVCVLECVRGCVCVCICECMLVPGIFCVCVVPAPNWRQIKLGTHYVFDKNFEIVFATTFCHAPSCCCCQRPAAHYSVQSRAMELGQGYKSRAATQRIIK